MARMTLKQATSDLEAARVNAKIHAERALDLERAFRRAASDCDLARAALRRVLAAQRLAADSALESENARREAERHSRQADGYTVSRLDAEARS